MTTSKTDLTAVKERQQGVWATGNYSIVGTTLQIVGENLCEALDLRAGSNVLDVAAGNGNATLAAARRFCDVTSTDYVPALLAAGEQRARADGLDVRFQVADVENLPFEDASFDVVLSTFGVMFTPDQDRAAAELGRVVKRCGEIGLANWTPESFVGQMFRVISKYVPPPEGVKPASLWGTRQRLAELFPSAKFSVRTSLREFVFRYRSPQAFLEIFRDYYGPMNRAFAALDGERRAALSWDLLELLDGNNRATDGTLVLPSEYLEVVVRKL